MKQGHKFQGLEFKNPEQMWTGGFAVAPCGILNWADGRCLRADFYIHFILGGMNSASNTIFLLMKSCFVSLCKQISSLHFSKASLYPWSGLCFFFFNKSPNGLPLKGACESLIGHSAIQSSLNFSPQTCGHVQLNADSRGETWKLDLGSTVKNVWSTSPTYQQGIPRIPSVWSVWGGQPCCHIQMYRWTFRKKPPTESLWLIFRLWCTWPMDFNLLNKRTNMHDGTSNWWLSQDFVMKFKELL